MSNDRLRAAITGAGMTVTSLSDRVGVDPKTVERWITKDRLPHRTHRMAVATALGQDDGYLWPSTMDEERTKSTSQAEFVTIYPNRGAVPIDTWLALTNQASESIDLLAYAASFLHDALPDFVDMLMEKASSGVQIRLLFGDPTSDAVALRGREEGIEDMLSGRCRLTWKYFEPIIGSRGVLARMHATTLYNSIFRFDETLLANTHAYGASASHSPVMYIQRLPGGRLFTNYMLSFERTWDTATPVTGD
jgi:lambda repressor-like predicted transcriptional regulator